MKGKWDVWELLDLGQAFWNLLRGLFLRTFVICTACQGHCGQLTRWLKHKCWWGQDQRSNPLWGQLASICFTDAHPTESCPLSRGSRWVSVNGLSYIHLQCWESATNHTANDGESAAVFSAANSNTFLGMDRFLWGTSSACATLPEGKHFKSFQTLPCYERETEAAAETETDCVLCVLGVSFPTGKNVLEIGWMCVPVDYLLVLVRRKEQSRVPGGRVAEGGAGGHMFRTEAFWSINVMTHRGYLW